MAAVGGPWTDIAARAHFRNLQWLDARAGGD